jgi:thiol-disulfide isomerase/thioredoxin
MKSFLLLLALCASAQTPSAIGLRDEFKTKREALKGFWQEFEVTQSYRSASSTQSSKRRLTLHAAGPRWRETTVSGSGTYIRVFDGKDLLRTEEGSDEFIRVKRKTKEDDPLPGPYGLAPTDWSKASIEERRPCGLPGRDDECVILKIPMKARVIDATPARMIKLMGGSVYLNCDTQTGMILSARSTQEIDNGRGGYVTEVIFAAKKLGYGDAPEESLFQMPETATKAVKELSTYNAARIKKQLVGKQAPDLTVNDIEGKPVSLAALKGKTVLLDFWTTWCPPCRADAPALDKLHKRFGEKDLAIVGISVSEEREIVAKFLKEHPHDFPIVLTSENDMPRPYQIGVFPTYMVINADGTLASAVEGDQGFAELRKLLKKAGLDVE